MVTISAVSFLLVWIASYNSNVILPLKLPFFDKILGWIGTRSYGLYLLNVPTNLTMKTAFARLSDHGLDLPYQISFPITLATFLISAEFLYRFIEQPFLKMGGRYAKKIMGLINSPKLETTPS
jgi:peptidoglycan/LPS O-acetylase OafA/YrhL